MILRNDLQIPAISEFRIGLKPWVKILFIIPDLKVGAIYFCGILNNSHNLQGQKKDLAGLMITRHGLQIRAIFTC